MVGEDGKLPLPWLDAPLAALLGSQRPHHALLLHGEPGLGQFELGLSLAQAWLCEAGGADGSATPRRPCGVCASCRLVQAHSHPDLLVVLPEALQISLGWPDEDTGAGGAKERKPRREIVVDQVRRLVAFTQLSPSRGRGQVVLLHPAERLNHVAANTVLKTLEEPPGALRFILCTGAAGRLLPTIRSRCQPSLLALPERATALAWLAEQGVKQPEVLLAATGGRPLEARDWAAEGIDAATWSQLPAMVASGQGGAIAGWPLPRLVDALGRLCHDAMLVACDLRPRYFEQVPAGASLQALQDWATVLRRFAAQAEHPLNAALAVESLVLQGQRALTRPRVAAVR